MKNKTVEKHYVRPLPFKPPKVAGFSERTLETLYEDSYGSVVQRLNRLERKNHPAANVYSLNAGEADKLHLQKQLFEAFFEALSDEPAKFPSSGKLHDAVIQSYDGIAQLKAAFARAAGNEPGTNIWAVLAWSRDTERLVSFRLEDAGSFIENTDLIFALPLDPQTCEADFSGNLSELVESFLGNIAWGRVSANFDQLVSPENSIPPGPGSQEGISLRELQEMANKQEVALLDVRLQEDRAHYGVKIPGTPWIEVHDIEAALDQIPDDRPVITYCVYGFWVSQDSAAALRKKGVDARYLKGGMAAWRAMGYLTEPN